jgi:hypothetical protein
MASSSSRIFEFIDRDLQFEKQNKDAFFYKEVDGVKYLCYIPKEITNADVNMTIILTENAPKVDTTSQFYPIDSIDSLSKFANSKFEFSGKSEENFKNNAALLETLQKKNNAFYMHFFKNLVFKTKHPSARPRQLIGPSVPLPSVPQPEEFNWDTVKSELLRKLPPVSIDDVIIQTAGTRGTFSGFVNSLFKLEAGRNLTWSFDDVIKKLSNEKSHIIEDNEKKLVQILYVIHVNTSA